MKQKYRVALKHKTLFLVQYRDEFDEIFAEAKIYEMKPKG